jgi:hypothetical protein
MTIYKYLGYHGVDVLRTLQLRVTPPDQFNDLFEFTPVAKGGLGNTDLAQLTSEKAMQDLYEELQTKARVPDFETFKAWVRRKMSDPNFVLGTEKSLRATMIENCRELCKDVSQFLGLICFAAERNNLLMWSHYANGHKGCVIGFNSNHRFFTNFARIRPVNYPPGDERVVWDSSLNPGDKGYDAMADAFVLTKSHHWQYEGEMRALLQLDGLEQRSIADGVAGYFLSFPADLIEEVIIGYRASLATDGAIRQALSLHGISETKFLRAQPDPLKFDLEFVPAIETR